MTGNFKKILAAIIVLVVLVVLGFVIFNKNFFKTEPVVISDVVIKNKTIGKSVEGRDVDVYQYGNGVDHLLFVGGIHGGYEWNSVLLAYQFIDYLAENPEIIPKNLTISVAPVANPDGLYKVVGREGRFSISQVSTSTSVLASGRFNANGVDLNRNFDCKWKPESMWQSKKVSAGTNPFSEPEVEALRNFILEINPKTVVFWHSKSNAVYASQCEDGILEETLVVMDKYADASQYKSVKEFSAYEVTGAADDWLSSVNIPAITVELQTHEEVEWDRNLAGIMALLEHFNISK